MVFRYGTNRPHKLVYHALSMSTPQFRSGASDMARAVAERERGRRWLTRTTAAISAASVAAAGLVAILLPGSTQASTGSSQRPASSGSTGPSEDSGSSDDSGSPGNTGSSSNSSSSGTLQAPSSAPVQSGGSPLSTSGGTNH